MRKAVLLNILIILWGALDIAGVMPVVPTVAFVAVVVAIASLLLLGQVMHYSSAWEVDKREIRREQKRIAEETIGRLRNELLIIKKKQDEQRTSASSQACACKA